jgi:hypothetical protein
MLAIIVYAHTWAINNPDRAVMFVVKVALAFHEWRKLPPKQWPNSMG